MPTHIDLLRLKRTSRINLFVPVDFINEETCPGIKRGGVLTVVRNEVEMQVTAGDIPDHLTVDLANYDVGDTVTISDIDLPDGTRTIIQGRDFVIANISAPSSLRSSDDEEGEGADTEETAVETDDGEAETAEE